MIKIRKVYHLRKEDHNLLKSLSTTFTSTKKIVRDIIALAMQGIVMVSLAMLIMPSEKMMKLIDNF